MLWPYPNRTSGKGADSSSRSSLFMLEQDVYLFTCQNWNCRVLRISIWTSCWRHFLKSEDMQIHNGPRRAYPEWSCILMTVIQRFRLSFKLDNNLIKIKQKYKTFSVVVHLFNVAILSKKKAKEEDECKKITETSFLPYLSDFALVQFPCIQTVLLGTALTST